MAHAGSDVVLRTLAAISQERVQRMRRAIAANAHRLVYGFDESLSSSFGAQGGDAMTLLLKRLIPRRPSRATAATTAAARRM